MPHIAPAIVLLAAGRATRMRGADKLMEEVDGHPLIRLMATRAAKAGASQTRVVLAEGQEARRAALDGIAGIDIVTIPAGGDMSDSLKAGIVGLDCAVMVLLADLPDLSAHDLYLMISLAQMHPDAILRAADAQGNPGHPIIFPSDLLPQMAQITGDAGARAIVQAHAHRVVHIPLPDQRATTDLDTPEDWRTWRAARGIT